MKKSLIAIIAVALCAVLAVPAFAIAQNTTNKEIVPQKTAEMQIENDTQEAPSDQAAIEAEAAVVAEVATETPATTETSTAAAQAATESQYRATCPYYSDADGNGVCDNCNAYSQNCPHYNGQSNPQYNHNNCPGYTDQDGNGVCDNCLNSNCPMKQYGNHYGQGNGASNGNGANVNNNNYGSGNGNSSGSGYGYGAGNGHGAHHGHGHR